MKDIKPELYLYAALGFSALYLYSKSKEKGAALGGRVFNKRVNSEVLVESVVPWLGIKNPLVKHLAMQGGKAFASSVIGEDNSDAIDAEYKRVR